jgi:preprotein translocase subunit SecE
VKRHPRAKKRGRRFTFVSDTVAELKKVVWPTREEVIRLTTMVLIICLVLALFLASIDYGFSRILSAFLRR